MAQSKRVEKRRSLLVSDPLWRKIEKATLEESARVGRRVSVSEWIRDAIKRKLNGGKGV